MVSMPYSSVYSWPIVFQGSFPFLRIGTKAVPSRSAMAPPRMKPRASMPATASTGSPRHGSAMRTSVALKPCASPKSVVTSRNMMPGFG